ncbi:C-glycoside deglycosidase beta subunit domain-containing protein [Allorhizobium undicola]|uniref:C-glycoside deglycosidase beta subunit domain-containing protein n=1 Tax=Allorhizobium undicola TaxID=78527 RepID=UPI003D3531E7
MMTNVLLERDSLTVRENQLSFTIRLPWYRSLPLSVIVIDELRVDDRVLDLDSVRFALNGAVRKVSELADLANEYWFVQDSLVLITDCPADSSEHDVDVTLSFFPPYIADFRRKTRGFARMKVA